MECTQRLDCLTQELYESRQERTISEQIGFLGICGTKYPIKRGPNKIGRDPQTCNIVLDLNSVSRQHAVINVLNSKEYMIMDLDSANKTKLLNKSLQPYIPQPLKNGDTVQFGQIFGIFRLLEDDDDLPMTQALEIPDTPVVNRHVSKLNNMPSTTIPESPDCSDKDESFIVSSQSKNQGVFKSPNSHFTKKIGRTITIQPVGENKIDNAYWKSTKKSVSIDMSLDESIEDLGGIVKPLTIAGLDINEDIHEMDTQVPYPTDRYGTHDAIHTADTQISSDGPSLSGLDTHLIKKNNLPDIQKTNMQQDMKLDLFMNNKENSNQIFNAETKQINNNEVQKLSKNINVKECTKGTSNPNFNISDEEIIFDEVDSLPLSGNFESQPLIPENFLDGDIEEKKESQTNNEDIVQNDVIFNDKKVNRTRQNSDSSTDCDDFDILPTQKIPEEPQCYEGVESANKLTKTKNNILTANDDSTDCEDNIMETGAKEDPIKGTNNTGDDNDSTDCEDDIIPCNSDALTKEDKHSGFEDLATQVIAIDKPNEMDNFKDKSATDSDFEDMPTQVIEAADIENTSKRSDDFCFEDLPTQVITVETPKEVVNQNSTPAENLPFKMPFPSVKKSKKKELIKPDLVIPAQLELEDDNFYNATQEILNDLCTQNDSSTEKETNSSKCGLEPRMKEVTSKNKVLPALVLNKSSERSVGDDKVSKYVKSLSHNQIKDIIGVDKQKNHKVIRSTFDNSDLESTPKKPTRFMETDLPNSQEIKKSVSLKIAKTYIESSSDSEPEEVEECSSIVSHKSKTLKSARIDLTKKFEPEFLPTRLLTRVRKPTAKAQDSNMDINKMMRSRLVAGSEENIDTEIIMENMLRLKTKTSKSKSDDEARRSSEAKNYKTDVEHSKPACIQLADAINNKKSAVKMTAKRKSEESKQVNIDKSEENEKEINKSNRNDSNTKSTEKRTRRDNKSINLKKESKPNNDKKEDIQISEKTSERTSRRSPRTAEKGHGDNKEEKTRESLEKKSSSKRVRSQKEEAKPIKKYDKVSNVKSSRSTRSRQKEDSKKEESKSSATNKIESDKKDKRKRKIEESVNETADKEMRRSKRQKTMKSYLEPKPAQNSSASSSSKHEQSTIYNISAESSNEKSPKETSGKRTAKDDDVIIVKRKSAPNLSKNTSSRSTPRNIKTHKVLFTAFPCEEVKDKLVQLGAIIVNELSECTVLLTLQIKRTFKLLCAIGLGRPIVGPSWVQACVDTNMIVDPWLYIIKDEASEKRFQFNLERTLTGRRNFLQGFNVSSTPSIVPKPSEMKLIVESSGGTWKEGGSKWVCITCSSDKTLWLSLKRKGAILVSTEFILAGVLQQKCNIEKHRLS